VHGALLAAVHPDNTPHGYNWTFVFPMLMFIIVAGALYLRFRSAHQVPGHVALESSRWAKATTAATTTTTAAGAATAAVTTAAGAAGTAEQGQAQPAADAGDTAAESTEDNE
jgi:hypothetical protein